MGERPDQIERQIAETRSELRDNVGELQDKVKSAVDSAGDRTYSAPSYDTSSATPGKSSDLRKTIEALTGALLGVAVNQASGFLDSVLPGFHQEFTKARAGKYKDSSRDNSPMDTSTYGTTKDPASPKPLTAAASA
jgi:hypothetical protein